MATSGTYYLDGPSLASATAVYTDAALTTKASDGFYSNETIVREHHQDCCCLKMLVQVVVLLVEV